MLKGLTDLSVVMVMTGGATVLAVMEWSGGVFLGEGLLFFSPQLFWTSPDGNSDSIDGSYNC